MPSCPCTPDKAFEECCAPYIEGRAFPETAEQLMRSRYSAYCRGDWDYLNRTTAEATRPKDKGGDQLDWIGLEILANSKGQADDATGEVEFIARFRHNGRIEQLHERSRFIREDGHWVYLDGRFTEASPTKVGRNDPCPCGSGKKFKKCCGG